MNIISHISFSVSKEKYFVAVVCELQNVKLQWHNRTFKVVKKPFSQLYTLHADLDMLDRLIKIKGAVCATLAMTRPDLMVSVEDWATVEAAVPILKMFYDVTN